MHISGARLASFCHLGFISDPLIVSKFNNETHDPKGQENKIYTTVKGRETFYRCHTVPVTSCSEVKYVFKRVSFGSKDCTKELKLESAYFLGETSKLLPFRLHQNLFACHTSLFARLQMTAYICSLTTLCNILSMLSALNVIQEYFHFHCSYLI